MFIGGDGCAVVAGLEMAMSTYSTGSGHPYPLELSFTRRVTRTRIRVGKCFHTRTRKAYPRNTYNYHIFPMKINSFQTKIGVCVE